MKRPKIVCGWGSATDPAVVTHDAPTGPLSRLERGDTLPSPRSSPLDGNHLIYQLQPQTESAPRVVRLLSAETECPPKVSTFGAETESEIRSTSSFL